MKTLLICFLLFCSLLICSLLLKSLLLSCLLLKPLLFCFLLFCFLLIYRTTVSSVWAILKERLYLTTCWCISIIIHGLRPLMIKKYINAWWGKVYPSKWLMQKSYISYDYDCESTARSQKWRIDEKWKNQDVSRDRRICQMCNPHSITYAWVAQINYSLE